MKINQASKISHLQITEKSGGKVKTIQSLIKQFCSPQCSDSDQLTPNLTEVVIQKKIVTNTSSQSSLKIEKYVKIKKNKRRQKKKLISIPTETQNQNKLNHELCSCCASKIDNALTLDDQYESEEDCYADDSSQINSIIQTIGQQILQQYYDKIDKAVSRIMSNKNKNSSELQNSKIFFNVMKKLAEIYTGYYRQLQQDISRQFEGEAILIPLESSWSVPQQFKEYIIGRFPLLKDFIQNFKLGDLTDNQMKQFKQLKSNNPLMEIISNHMEDIALKKNKKKNKRQLQKLSKKSQENYSKNSNSKIVEDSTQPQEVIERLQNMKINQKQRLNCYIDAQWLMKIKNQLKKGIK